MSKFRQNQRVIVKDNPTWGGGQSFARVDPIGEANPGTMLIVVDPDTDIWGDIQAKPVHDGSRISGFYISEDSVVSAEADVRAGDRIRVEDNERDILLEGTVNHVAIGSGSIGVYLGKSKYDAVYAGSLSMPERYTFTVLKRPVKWPDHEGFIRITGGLNAGQRGLARRATYSDQILIDTDAGETLWGDTMAGQGFDFEYVEG